MNKIWLTGVVAGFFLLTSCASSPPGGGESSASSSSSSDQTDSQHRAGIRLQLAIEYYQQRQLNTALDELRLALQADPNMADAYSVRGLIYMDMGDMRAAEENFQRAIRLAPNNPDISNNYGWFLCQSGRESQAIPYFEATLKNRSYQSPAKALNNAAICSIKLKDLDAAERYLTEAFRYEPGNAITNVNLAKVHYARGDVQRARFYIQRMLKAEVMTAEVLWVAIKVERKLNDRTGEAGLVNQLRRRHPNSSEYASYLRGAFDE